MSEEKITKFAAEDTCYDSMGSAVGSESKAELAEALRAHVGETLHKKDDHDMADGSRTDRSVDNRQPPRHMHWTEAVWAINAQVLGIGVLTIPQVFGELGWLLAFVGLICCLLANAFIAFLMTQVQQAQPRAISIADAMYYAFGRSKKAKMAVRWIIYFEKTCSQCPYIVLMARSLGTAFPHVHLCEYYWCIIVFSLPLAFSQLRTIKDTHYVNVVNVSTLFSSLALMCVGVAVQADPQRETFLIGAGGTRVLTFMGIFGTVAKLVFAFAGSCFYYEIMSEMDRPKDFMKAFAAAGAMQIVLYAFVGAFGYYFVGSNVPASIFDGLRIGTLGRSASFLLAVHVFCGIITAVVILVRFFHSQASPRTLNEDGVKSRMIRFFLCASLYGGATIVALSLPSIGGLVTLLGGLLEAPISFIMPILAYCGVMYHVSREARPRLWVFVLCGVIVCTSIIIMVAGVSAGVHMFATETSRPFSCNCQGMWDTCACSSSRMPLGTCPAHVIAPAAAVGMTQIGGNIGMFGSPFARGVASITPVYAAVMEH